jgi:hypothetical protein
MVRDVLELMVVLNEKEAEKLTPKEGPQLSAAINRKLTGAKLLISSSLVHDNDNDIPCLFSKMHLEPYKYRPPLPKASSFFSSRISLHPTLS